MTKTTNTPKKAAFAAIARLTAGVKQLTTLLVALQGLLRQLGQVARTAVLTILVVMSVMPQVAHEVAPRPATKAQSNG